MILYTPLAATDIFPHEGSENYCCLQYKGKSVYAKKLDDGSYEVQQLLSTDPNDFLSGQHMPGTVIQPSEASILH